MQARKAIIMPNADVGAHFLPARQARWEDVERVLDSFGTSTENSIIFHNDDLDIYRVVKQTFSGRVMVEYRVLFIAAHIVEETYIDDYIITHGSIRTRESARILAYEQVGKRLLYRATKEIWNLKY